MTKEDMTEIAQVLANGVVRVYMGAGGCGGSGLPGGSHSGNDANSDRSLRHWGVGGPTGDSNTPGHLRGEADLNAEITRLRGELDATERQVNILTEDLNKVYQAVKKLHAAKGRHHTQLAACDLFDLVGLPNERPKK